MGSPHRLIKGIIMRLSETKSKASRVYVRSGQYHTIVEVRDSYQNLGYLYLTGYLVIVLDASLSIKRHRERNKRDSKSSLPIIFSIWKAF